MNNMICFLYVFLLSDGAICGSNSVYQRCGSECVFFTSDRQILRRSEGCNDCFAGCFCKQNYARDMISNECVHIDKCKKADRFLTK